MISHVLTIDGKEEITAYPFDAFPVPEYNKDLICCLDTETSKITKWVEIAGEQVEQPIAVWVYQWAVKLGPTYVYGRSISDFGEFLDRMEKEYFSGKKPKKGERLIIYVHNLAYDMSYLIMYLYERYRDAVKPFVLQSRKYLKVAMPFFEFRCSYRLQNKSLDAWCCDEHLYHIKATGAIEYNVIRYPDQELTEEDWYYQFSDVASMYDGIAKCLQTDTLATIPLTSTGYVRRDLRAESEKDKHWRRHYLSIRPTAKTYPLMKAAFQGGWVHANRNYTDLIQEDALGFDATSMYPAVLVEEKFPTGTFYRLQPKENVVSKERFNAYYEKGFAMLFEVRIRRLQLKKDASGQMLWNPYISSSKCATICRAVLDNGKVMYGENLTLYVTEIDWKWIRAIYDIYEDDWLVTKCYIAKKDYLPDWFIRTVERWFWDKSMLKGDETEDGQRRYMEAKARLNALYGMLATDPIRDEYELDFATGEWTMIDKHTPEEMLKLEQKKVRSSEHGAKDNFLPYQWGIWTTAYARDRLFTAMLYCHKPLYCDTDSVKGSEWDLEGLARYNEEIAEKARRAGNFDLVLPNGKRTTLGVFTDDGYYKTFKALHAKCYGYTDENNRLHITVSGVTKRGRDGRTKEEELGKLENMTVGFRFTSCGGTRSTFIDRPHTIEIDGHNIISYGGCAILDTTYLIGDCTTADELVRMIEMYSK